LADGERGDLRHVTQTWPIATSSGPAVRKSGLQTLRPPWRITTKDARGITPVRLLSLKRGKRRDRLPKNLSGEETMNRPNITTHRLAALFILGALLFNYPLLALFNRPALTGGIPILYLYVFAAWALLVALLVLVIERR
jgi:hypothetical protein